jgi:hypothetical protein
MVRQIVTKLILFIGDYQDVIVDALGKACDLGFDRKMSGIGPPRPRNERPRFIGGETA